MKHKRQTLSKDDPEIKESKSKSESSLNEDKNLSCQTCELPPGAAHQVKDEDGHEHDFVKKEDMSDDQEECSVSSIPESSEGGGTEGGIDLPPGGDQLLESQGGVSEKGGVATAESPSRGSGGGGKGSSSRSSTGLTSGLPVGSNLNKNLTSLANLSPTPKSLMTGESCQTLF